MYKWIDHIVVRVKDLEHPKAATPECVFDLTGNVAEWTCSLFAPYPYDAGDGREDPKVRGERVRGAATMYSMWRLISSQANSAKTSPVIPAGVIGILAFGVRKM